MEFDRTLDASPGNAGNTLPFGDPGPHTVDPNGATIGATTVAENVPGGTLPGAFAGPASLRATARSVLPRVEPGEGGAPRLIHETAERFLRQQSLGVGGMGEVEQAIDRDIGRPVAIKRILPEAAGAAGIARFVTEVRVVGALEHPNVVPLHDVGMDADGRYFFVMKYVEGKTLETLIEELKMGDESMLATWSFERRIELFIGVLRALAFAHSRGIIHRDVKPANIMIGRLGEVWLMDWGVAKVQSAGIDLWDVTNSGDGTLESRGKPGALGAIVPTDLRTTRHGSLVGTPAYMAPEQAAGAVVDPRADLYSAAVVFHEFIALEHYLDHKMTSLPELLGAIKTELPQFWQRGTVAQTHAPVPAELIHFCRLAMAKNPAERYANAEAMIEELQQVVAGKVPVRCAVTFTKRMSRESGRFVDRKPLVALAGMLVALAMFCVTITSVVVLALRH
jgi:serine/threonine-protein kinase